MPFQPPKQNPNCEACGKPDTIGNPTYAYEGGAFYHDQCADDAGIPESEML
jgi:hypothetical protein